MLMHPCSGHIPRAQHPQNAAHELARASKQVSYLMGPAIELAHGRVVDAAVVDLLPQQRLLPVVGRQDGDLVRRVAPQPQVLIQRHQPPGLLHILCTMFCCSV